MMGHNRPTKVTIVSFPPKRCLRPICSKNYAALYFVIHFNNFFETLYNFDGVPVAGKNKSQFFKKIPCKGKWVICVQFGPNVNTL